jgi:hypothetical protein
MIGGDPTDHGETLIPYKNNKNSLITIYKNILTLYFHAKSCSRECVIFRFFTISKVKCMQVKRDHNYLLLLHVIDPNHLF